MKITLVNNNSYLLLTPYEIEKDNSGLIIEHRDSHCLGKVAFDYVPHWEEEDVAYSKGEIVMFDPKEAQRCWVNDVEYIIVDSCDIIAKVELDG